jgi:hypothetical protein
MRQRIGYAVPPGTWRCSEYFLTEDIFSISNGNKQNDKLFILNHADDPVGTHTVSPQTR